jgi:flagellar hook-associated protein 2
MAGVQIDGLVSGIDTQTIIDGLLKIQKQQVDRFTLRKQEIQQKQSAFRGIEARLLTLRGDVGKLSRAQNNPISKQLVKVSDETAISATASDSAVAGVYRIKVESTARAHQVASQGFTDADAEITKGTLDLRTGSGTVKTITIDDGNNTLSGLVTAINSSGAGISASVIRDASGGSSPYRLLLTSSETGTENAISVTNNLAAGAGAAVKPELDFNNPVQAAADAEITIGSGAGAISVASASNHFEDVIAGVDFDLLQVDSGDELTLTVRRDVDGAVDAVESFVKSFNDTLQYVDDQSRFNVEANVGGLLLGNRTATSIQQKLRSTILNVVPGVNTSANRLSAIGITVTDNGRLQLNSSKLRSVLEGQDSTVSAADVKRLFALDGVSDNSGVSFVLGSSRTKSSATPYGVDITQAAERAEITAGSALAASTVITAANRELELTVDGASTTVTLAEGTYTRQQLADHLQSVINGNTDLKGRQVRVGLESDKLVISSESYGKSSEILIESGTALTDLGLTSGLNDIGQDVAGSFIVNGKAEAATGRGRVLSGNSDNENTADLQVRVSLTSSQIVSGVESEITVTSGVGASLDNLLAEFLDTENGIVSNADDGFSDQIDGIQKSLDRQQATFDRQQAALLKQFTALESALSNLKSTSSFVSSQLAGKTA